MLNCVERCEDATNSSRLRINLLNGNLFKDICSSVEAIDVIWTIKFFSKKILYLSSSSSFWSYSGNTLKALKRRAHNCRSVRVYASGMMLERSGWKMI